MSLLLRFIIIYSSVTEVMETHHIAEHPHHH
jgi:hypothetical protein